MRPPGQGSVQVVGSWFRVASVTVQWPVRIATGTFARRPRIRSTAIADRVVIQLRSTEADRDRWKALAASENLGLSEWIRRRCEGRTEAPVASQGVSGEVKPITQSPGHIQREAVRPVTPGKHGRGVPGASLCSRTGFPVEACLCPLCKNKR